jgi:hypothetical protein
MAVSTTPSVVPLGHHIVERAGLAVGKLGVGRQAIADELLAVAEHEVLKILRLCGTTTAAGWLTVRSPANQIAAPR